MTKAKQFSWWLTRSSLKVRSNARSSSRPRRHINWCYREALGAPQTVSATTHLEATIEMDKEVKPHRFLEAVKGKEYPEVSIKRTSWIHLGVWEGKFNRNTFWNLRTKDYRFKVCWTKEIWMWRRSNSIRLLLLNWGLKLKLIVLRPKSKLFTEWGDKGTSIRLVCARRRLTPNSNWREPWITCSRLWNCTPRSSTQTTVPMSSRGWWGRGSTDRGFRSVSTNSSCWRILWSLEFTKKKWSFIRPLRNCICTKNPKPKERESRLIKTKSLLFNEYIPQTPMSDKSLYL